MTRGKICFAFMVSDKDTATSFTLSLVHLALHDLTHHGRIFAGGGFVPTYAATETIASTRNELTAGFLDQSDAELFGMIDSDMGFPPDVFDRLAEIVDPIEKPFVGALCFAQRIVGQDPATNSPRYKQFPTIYTWHESELEKGFAPASEVPENTLIRCDGTGAACFLVHRHLLERIREKHGNNWWTKIPKPEGGFFGEDLSFCLRVRELGNAIHVHTGVEVSHQKPTHLSLETFRAGPPLPNVVVIPSKNHELVERLVDALQAQGEAAEIIVCDNGMEGFTGVTELPCEGMGIHEMWNAGWQYAKQRHGQCNVAFLNDDITIGPKFLSGLAKQLRSDPNLIAVSPNYDQRPAPVNVQYVDDICAGRYDGTGGLAGFAFMLRGEFPYLFPTDCKWWFGDNDLVLTINARGYRSGIVLNTTCQHEGGLTGDWDAPAMTEQLEKDKQAFLARWAA